MTAHLDDAGSFTAAVPRRSQCGRVRGLVAAGAVIALLIAGTGTASADSATGDVTANVQVLGGITLTGLPTSFLLSGAPGATLNAPVGYTVSTNNIAGYSVTVDPDGDLQPATSTNLDSIPIADLLVGATPLTGASQLVHTKAVKSANGGDSYTDTYSMTIPYVNADTYTATLTYTATTL